MSRLRRLAFGGLFALAVLCAQALVVRFPLVLTALGVEPPAGWWFVDTYALLASSDAVALGLDPYAPNPLDLLHVPHWYSDWWFGLAALGLTRADTYAVGAAIVGVFLASAVWLLRPARLPEAVFAWLVLSSPPFLLGVNRANADLLVCALMVLLVWLLTRAPRWVWGAGATAVVALAAGLKFYPIVAGGALVTAPRPARERWVALLLMGGGAIAVGVSVAEAVVRALPLVLPPVGFFSFGASAWFGLLGLTPPAAHLAAWVVGLALAFGWWRLTPDVPEGLPEGERAAFAVGALLIAGCFFAGVGYSYRLVFAVLLLPLLRTWGGLKSGGRGSRTARWVLWLTLPLLWIDGLACAAVNLGWAARLGLDLSTVEAAAGWATHSLGWLWVAGICGLLLALYRPACASLVWKQVLQR